MDKRPIGVFDSGIGGLSVLRELERLLPHENFVFFADQLYVPYGEKNDVQIQNLAERITNYLLKHHHIKMLVVACNTATCAAITHLRKKYYFPIVGTVPAIKPATEKTKTKTVGIISTPSTSKSKVLKNLIRTHGRGVKVINIGCKGLEDTVEQGNLEGRELAVLLETYLKKIKNSKTDCLVLGCTHYPFLKDSISKILGKKVKLIDGNVGIAEQTAHLLTNHFLENTEQKKGRILYLTTGDPDKFSKVAGKLLKKKIKTQKVAF